MAVSEVIRRNL